MIREVITKTLNPHQSKQSTNSGTEIELSRRAFVQVLGAGLLISVTEEPAFGQRRGRRRGSRGARNVAARLRINQDGTITVMTGKVEEGQGSRAQLTQAAAEELRVDVAQINLVMAGPVNQLTRRALMNLEFDVGVGLVKHSDHRR